MTRLRADILLLFTALIWGTAFIAQKTALDTVGPLTFVGFRFMLAALSVLPLAWWDLRRRNAVAVARNARDPDTRAPFAPANVGLLIATGVAFFAGSALQQVGLTVTTVTNAGFLTTVYVVLVPVVVWLMFRRPPAFYVWIAAGLSIVGVWLIGDASLTSLTWGDGVVLVGAIFWATHVVLIGLIVMRTDAPFLAVFVQYVITGLGSLVLAATFEQIAWGPVISVVPELLYAGIISGGIAFTLQAVAQRHTPAVDAAVILGSESLFAALAGAILLGERLSPLGLWGCALIFTAMLVVELAPLTRRKWATRRARAGA